MRGHTSEIQIVSTSLSRQRLEGRGTLGLVSVRRSVVALVLLVATLWARGSAVSQSRAETVVSGLDVPWAIAFAPDGAIYVTERLGLIRVVRNGRLDPKAIAILPVAARGESGLMGLALDPDFARNGHLYTC